MTYCVGMLLKDGMVLASDSRTNAGMDHISTFRKMTIWEVPGERIIVLMTAGNLATSQAVVNALSEGVEGPDGELATLLTTPSMSQAARLTGAPRRTAYARALEIKDASTSD